MKFTNGNKAAAHTPKRKTILRNIILNEYGVNVERVAQLTARQKCFAVQIITQTNTKQN